MCFKIVSRWKGPPPPPGPLGKEYLNADRLISEEFPRYHPVVVYQRLHNSNRIYMSTDTEDSIYDDFGFSERDVVAIMKANFTQDDLLAFFLNSTWCGHNGCWAASDAYILNPYEKDTKLRRTEVRKDYYCKFFLNSNIILNSVSFHSVRDPYNGVEYVR